MNELLKVIFAWFLITIILIQVAINKDLNDKITGLEIENRNREIEVENLKTLVEDYQNKTERMIDTNIQIITEGGWK